MTRLPPYHENRPGKAGVGRVAGGVSSGVSFGERCVFFFSLGGLGMRTK